MQLNIDLRGIKHFYDMSGGYFVTTFLNNGIPFLILPILTRYLTPSEYANIALFGLFLALSNALVGSSIPAIIAKNFFRQEQQKIAQLATNSILLALLLALLVSLVILLTYPFLYQYIKLDLFWMLIIPFASFLWITLTIGLTILRNMGRVLLFSQHQIGNTLLNVMLTLLFVMVMLWGWQGRVYGILLSYLFSALLMLLFLQGSGYLSRSFSLSITKEILVFVTPLIPNSVQSVFIMQMGLLLLSLYFSSELLGIYAIAFQIAYIIYLVTTALSLSWSPLFYRELANNPDPQRRLYLTRMLILLIGVLFCAVLLLNMTAGLILRIMTTAEYFGAVVFIPYITLGLMFHGMFALLSPVLIHFEQQRYIGFVSFVVMLLAVALNLLSIEQWGYIGVAYAFTATYFIMFLAFLWKAQQCFPLPWLQAVKIWH